MKRFISTTSVLVMLLSGPTLPAIAQEIIQADIDGQIVLCLPDKKTPCPEGAMCVIVKNPANCEKRAMIFLDDLANGVSEPAPAEEAVAEEMVTEEPVTEEAAPEDVEAAKDAADQDAADQVAADQAAADQAAAEEAAADQAAADQAAAEEAAADQAAADQAAADQAAADQAAADQAAADQAAAEEAAADQAAAEEAAALEGTTEEPVAEVPLDPALTEVAPAEAALEETGELVFEPFEVFVGDQPVLCLPDPALECPEGQICTIARAEQNCGANAEKKLAKLNPVEVVEPEEAEIEALGEIIGDPATSDASTIEAAATPEVALGEEPVLPSETDTSPDATVTEEVLSEEDTRSATQEFDAAPTEVAPGKKSGLSNLEIAGLAILGTLAIGAILDQDKEVVENTGDRVVVQDADGNYTVYKDDNALLREPGNTVRTETFSDGSTRTVMVRPDGSQVVTIRDATGRVLQRTAYNKQGVQTALIDDLDPEDPVDVTRLPKPRPNAGANTTSTFAEIKAELAELRRADYAGTFSLRQIREIRQVRDLAPTIDVNNVTFDSGSSAIKKSEAKKLQRLGRLMLALIKENPGEILLIEGHTDAVGRGGYNLALSDRRAESVARALTEFYGVPAENLVVQGYGEKELKIDTQGDERANRRAVVRIISPLLKVSQR